MLAKERLFSPHREAPIIVDSDDDDDGDARPANSINSPMKGKKPASRTGPQVRTAPASPPSEDYDAELDDEDMYDEELLSYIAQVEASNRAPTLPPGQRGQSVTVTGTSGRWATSHREVIDIDDDEDDKENVPAPTRHVRRRVAPTVTTTGPVIEISD